jgi:hypothetical protein
MLCRSTAELRVSGSLARIERRLVNVLRLQIPVAFVGARLQRHSPLRLLSYSRSKAYEACSRI